MGLTAIQIRCSDKLAAAWKRAAKREGITLSEWIRQAGEQARVVSEVATVLRAKGPTRRGKLQSTPVDIAPGEDDRGRGHGRGKLGLKGRVSGRLPAKG
jgi:hypothetical protein